MTVDQLEAGEAKVLNAYERSVKMAGNKPAQEMIGRVFEACDRKWRGIGVIPDSGWQLREEYATFDAEERFEVGDIRPEESPLCIAGQILQGEKKPVDCAAFGVECTPERPLGAPMVSAEGACAAHYRYRRDLVGQGA
jgi:hydrogenase expression/formation protein HypD